MIKIDLTLETGWPEKRTVNHEVILPAVPRVGENITHDTVDYKVTEINYNTDDSSVWVMAREQ